MKKDSRITEADIIEFCKQMTKEMVRKDAKKTKVRFKPDTNIKGFH